MKKPNNDRIVLSASELAKERLKEKYSFDFEVTELSKRDNGSLKDKEYVGYAYLIDNPNERFTIWVNQEEKIVVDSYDCIRINEIANEWLNNCVKSIWKDPQVEAWSLLVSKPSSPLSKYSNANIEEYFLKEFSSNDITIFVSEFSNDEADNIAHFLNEISCISNGIVHINYLDRSEKGELIINLASNRTDIENQINSWGNS